MPSPLPRIEPAAAGFRQDVLDKLCGVIEAHIAERRYPGAQIALARDGKLAFTRTFGTARIEPAVPAGDDTLWLLFSNTKVVTSAAIWALVEDAALTFHDRISDHVPEFAQNGKRDITLLQVMTHQGGMPNAATGLSMQPGWDDHAKMRKLICGFTLEHTPGSRVHYHAAAAHWICAMLIEAVTGADYRDFIRARVIEPLGLGSDLFVGMPDSAMPRAADMHEPSADGKIVKLEAENTAPYRRAGIPSSGGYATAAAMAAFYQALVGGGALNGRRIVSPRMMEFVTRNFTGDRIDAFMNLPMHRGLGPHSRGPSDQIRGLGTIASPSAFGHGGVGSSYCWADPETGTSFAYISNSRVPDPWHSRRMDIVSTMVHAAIEDAPFKR